MKLPIILENSKLPIWLSYIAPIDVGAFSFFIIVASRGTMSERTKRHETIHYKQQLEMLFIFQWIMYGFYHLKGLLSGLSGDEAYYVTPFELEAYENDDNSNYLKERKSYAWLSYL